MLKNHGWVIDFFLSSHVKRLDITMSKVITAMYKGEAIKTKSGKDDFCLDYPNKDTEFNKCP